MLKDRRLLMEQEIAKLTATCGHAYLDALQVPMTANKLAIYNSDVEKLSTMQTQLAIIIAMINKGHE